MTAEMREYIRLLRDRRTSHLRAENCNTSPAEFVHLEKAEIQSREEQYDFGCAILKASRLCQNFLKSKP
jgi:hypothetical protein